MNGYDVVRQIGEGAFGKAFLVRDQSSAIMCVIKEIKLGKVQNSLATDVLVVVVHTILILLLFTNFNDSKKYIQTLHCLKTRYLISHLHITSIIILFINRLNEMILYSVFLR